MIDCAITDYANAQYLLQLFIDNAGYWLVFLFMVIESSFLPFPSEVVVPPAAFLAAQTSRQLIYNGHTIDIPDMNVVLIVLVATAGAITGALINYYLSVWVGRPIVYAFANSKFGHACLIDHAKVEKAEKYFDEHGSSSTFIGRLIPAVRQLISIPAGLARMNIVKFVVFTGLGALLWNCILAVLGYWLGKTIDISQLYAKVEEYNGYLTWAGLALLAGCIGYIVWNVISKRNK
ncbi:MAG: DedA family protein [Bacteroidales bacterium]|nr:DedA family protein [Bacteroidales bacterium]